MRAPRRDHYRAPVTGPDTAAALDTTIKSLGAARDLDASDSGTTLHLLASVLAQAQALLPQAVGQARVDNYSWAEIADLLGVTRASAWQRYAGRPEPLATAKTTIASTITGSQSSGPIT